LGDDGVAHARRLKNVGWVERSDTHSPTRDVAMGFAKSSTYGLGDFSRSILTPERYSDCAEEVLAGFV